MSNVFNEYAGYYNAFYADKDYVSEAEYVRRLLADLDVDSGSLLDMGCGTGRHALLLERSGFKVTGFDLSDEMISVALSHKTEESSAEFLVGDTSTFRSIRKFEAIVSLFHVASYQNTNEELMAFLRTAETHMLQDSVFVFDFWYTPAVLEQRPETRVKRVVGEDREYLRLAVPFRRDQDNIVEVNYSILSLDSSSQKYREFSEKHCMRHFSLPEIHLALDAAGLVAVKCEEWLTGNAPSSNTWGVVVAAKRK